jgi:quaternary ammonium compound-resistance protein SugE
MDWTFLVLAGLLEVGWAVGLKFTDGFTRLWPSVFTLATLAASMLFLALAVRTIPIGTGYAVWTGIGAAGTAILGIALFNESADGARLVFIAIVLLGLVGLKVTSGH